MRCAVKVFWLVVVLVVMVSMGGCLAMAVGYTGYALSKSSSENTDKEAQARIADSYSRYKTEMERTNMEREKAGLKPQPVQSFAEWKVASMPPKPEKIEAKAESTSDSKPETIKE